MTEFPQTLVNLPVSAKPPIETLPKLQALIAEADTAFGNDGRQLIRYSGTEKKIRILVEHRHANVVELWINRFTEVIQNEIG